MTDKQEDNGEYRHWRQTFDAEHICWLTLDKADASANTLSREVLQELEHILNGLHAEPPHGVVIRSAKPSGFILGADVREFQQLSGADEGARLAAAGQALLARLESLPCPTVAAINGFALGGGLELALACRYRVAVEGWRPNLGLPEVQLGIHPGFGGTVRAVQLLGAPRALDLMLTGRSVSPADALDVGLVDRIAPAERLETAAAALIREEPRPLRARWYLRLLNLAPARRFLAGRVRARVARRVRREHYPAPFALLDLWVRHGGSGSEKAYFEEARSIGNLLVSPTCRNLVRVFLLRERLRNLAPKSTAMHHVHVVGAGVMGGDIAAWCALRGLKVSLQDRSLDLVKPALARARKLFSRRLRGPGEAEQAEQRLTADPDGTAVAGAGLVIEAIVEKLEAKRSLFRELEQHVDDDVILASNTSSIVLEDIAVALRKPDRFVGLHFFNPVAKLPLVEVIRGRDTSDECVEKALQFVAQIGKVPLPCRSAPGFVVNRVLMPYMLEALVAHQEGHALETIDTAARRFGMPMGPVELADQVGLDVALHVAGILGAAFGIEVPDNLRSKVDAGELGVKSGHGFYVYDGGKPSKRRDFPAPDRDLTDRLILALVNEAVACLDEDVVEDADLLDAGVVFGTGFAPHTGGPLQYARDRGIEEVVTRLSELAERHGPRFRPHEGWRRLADKA